MLCEVCQNVLREDHEDVDEYSPQDQSQNFRRPSIPTNQTWPFFRAHHYTIPGLKQSSDHGCHFCYMIWTAAPSEVHEAWQNQNQNQNIQWMSCFVTVNRAVFQNQLDTKRLILEYKYQMPIIKPDDYLQSFRKHFRLLWPEDATLLAEHSRMGTNTWCKESWDAFRIWMWTCISHHDHCSPKNVHSRKRHLPTRLLEIGSGNMVYLRIVGRIEDRLTLEYIALSHCWGSGPRLKLTQSTSTLLSEGIDIYQLSKTFREAILVTKRFAEEFGVRYLWIDSLCIDQGSMEDWRHESAIMGEIYQNAFCTIAATAAMDGTVGLFHDRDLRQTIPCTIPTRSKTGTTQTFTCIDEGDWGENVSRAPVNQRAWVFQERLLSPRIVHFSGHQLYWECSELEASEAFRRGFPSGTSDHFKRLLPFSEPHKPKSRTNPRGPHAIWDQIMTMYSAGNLTRRTDRLVALSGIAHKIQRRILQHDTYLAGLWKSDLAFELLWDTNGQNEEAFREYIAPSWSWASRARTVPCETDMWASATKLIEVKKTAIQSIGKDAMGQISGGYLRLSGTLVHGHLSRVFQVGSDSGIALKIDDRAMNSAICSLDDGLNSSTRLPYVVYCLPILKAEKDDQSRYRGLILVPTGREREFRRYGTFTTDASDEFTLTRALSLFDTGEIGDDGRCEVIIL